MSVAEYFSGVDVDDLLQLRKKKLFLTCFGIIMCSIWVCHRIFLSTMRHSRETDRQTDRDRGRQTDRQKQRDRERKSEHQTFFDKDSRIGSIKPV